MQDIERLAAMEDVSGYQQNSSLEQQGVPDVSDTPENSNWQDTPDSSGTPENTNGQAPETSAIQEEPDDSTREPEPQPTSELSENPTKDESEKSIPANFHITDPHLGEGGPKTKFRRNIDAIRLLKILEEENRPATQKEQETLSKYVGFGGLANAFDETKPNWKNEYEELKNLLTPQEYQAAKESTLNAHYTSPAVIQAIYDAVGQFGFQKGRILEPAMGVGNFFGMLPETMQESELYGVELDSITGRIARKLYPNANITVAGFETTSQMDFYDLAVGNVPFGNYKVADKPYDNLGFSIHNYFFAKTLDQVRPGGLIAFITSRYTMDSQDSSARRYISDRAELLGAIRLPNNAFHANAGTDVVSDILFLKRRERTETHEDDWVYTTRTSDGFTINSYFAEHPELILGTLTVENTQYGREEFTVQPLPDKSLEEQLKEAVSRIHGTYEELREDTSEDTLQETPDILPADPDVKNYSYTLIDGSIYYREDSVMKLAALSGKSAERVKALIEVRDCTKELIRLQSEDYSDTEIKAQQSKLNRVYDDFSAKYGYINGRENKRLFDQDSSYYLLCSLEEFDGEGNFKGKAAMFSRRTIKRAQAVTSVDTSMEALTVSLNEKARVDLDFMAELTGKPVETITQELSGVIFQNPLTGNWETADEYLSGNVREKLSVARLYAENNEIYRINVSALERIQPKELGAADIEVRIGASWIEPRYIEDFMRDVLHTPSYLFTYHNIGVSYAPITGTWNVKGKSADSGNVLVDSTYGTSRANAYRILEDSLNLKDIRIFDTVKDEDGNERRVLNKKETTLAGQKQDMLREAFKDWIFKDQERRTDLVNKYNTTFNSTRPREYDGSHLTFPGMTPDIELRPHQLNAVAHQLYGNNTLLAHCVGAGKTFEMIAAAMESKRLGLCHKSLFVVPNHLTEQWASDFLRLYPGANILAATKKDFEPANRKKFCSRIATGDYDAVIIGHSQFEKIPLSEKRQAMLLEAQIDEIEDAIAQAKADKGENFTVKQLMKTRKSLEAKLKKLNDQSRKDDVVTFEQLGVDRLFVDESHNYKNLYLYTKMRNVAGIAQTEAQKSSDMFMKCRYLDEITGGKGITFATGTPISNSMTELYTNMRYLQFDTLNRMGLGQFDAWASSFGETQTAIELAPEGTGYRAKTRFAKFYNLPELIRLFKESADIQTPDMLKLPIPEAEYKNIVLKPSEEQKELVSSLADRAESVRNGAVSPTFDNMLKITNDGRKLALDQRLVSDALPDNEDSKTNACVERAFDIWKDTMDERSAQLIFCDLSTPKGDGTYNVYEDIKNKLMAKGVPEEEIAFIHDATTEAKKADLFSRVRTGQVRFLLGSTAKMGAGTNVQDKLIALHHLDVPWRPSDIEQQEGRILRQGNQNKKVSIYRYVTEGTFDSYSWQIIENKQKFIGQIMTSKSPVRSCEDVDEAALTYAEVKALSTGNPYIKEKMDLDVQVAKLKLLKANHTSQIYRLEDDITKKYPREIAALQGIIAGYRTDIETYQNHKPQESKAFSMELSSYTFTDKRKAGEMLISMCKTAPYDTDAPIG